MDTDDITALSKTVDTVETTRQVVRIASGGTPNLWDFVDEFVDEVTGLFDGRAVCDIGVWQGVSGSITLDDVGNQIPCTKRTLFKLN